ncbi:MAG: class I SAM-dependent methyltransferase [Phycisphaerales bacterium]
MSPSPSILAPLLQKSLAKRKPLFTPSPAFRAFSGPTEGIPGTFLDIYAQGATLITYEGTTPARFNRQLEAQAALEVLANSPLQTRAIYHKPFARDRSKLGGQLPEIVTDKTPLAGEELPESLTIREHNYNLEVRLYDGLSTGLFLDQRNNRKFLADWIRKRATDWRQPVGAEPPQLSILNTFAYTCAFSIAAAIAGALTTSVDISPRYLDWGKRNFALNNIDPAQHRFARMDTFEFFDYAQRKNLTYDFIVLDPPSFAAANKKRGTKAWSSLAHYATLVGKASQLLRPGGRGVIFASTNTQELCRPGRLEHEVEKGLSTFRRRPKYLPLPPTPIDFAMEKDRFAALAFECA